MRKINKSIKSLVMSIALVCCGAKLFASNLENLHPFELNPVNDSILMGTGTMALSLYVLRRLSSE